MTKYTQKRSNAIHSHQHLVWHNAKLGVVPHVLPVLLVRCLTYSDLNSTPILAMEEMYRLRTTRDDAVYIPNHSVRLDHILDTP